MLASVPAGYTPQFVHTPTAKAGSVLICEAQNLADLALHRCRLTRADSRTALSSCGTIAATLTAWSAMMRAVCR